jgi:hypothetical protein
MAKYTPTQVFDEASFEAIQDAADVAQVVRGGIVALQIAGVLDAEESIVFARQLESVRNRVYLKKFPEWIGRSLLPVTYEDALAEFVTMRVWTEYGMAKVVADYSTDFPRVGRSAVEYFVKPYEIGAAYGYNLKDLRRAARAGVSLKDADATTCRKVIEQGIEDCIAVGVPSLRTFGLLNHPNMTQVTFTNGSWGAATGEAILADLNQLVTAMWDGTLEIWRPDTILVSSLTYRLLTTKLLSTGNSSNVSVLNMFRLQNEGVTIKHWTKLKNANAAGNNSRIIVYKNDPEVLEFLMGTDFEALPAEQIGMDFEHKCYATVFGVLIHHPQAVLFADNHNYG